MNDVPVSAISLAEVRQAVAVVPQEAMLFDKTISCNIGFGRAGATQEQIEAAARIAELYEQYCECQMATRLTVGERGVKLSGGEGKGYRLHARLSSDLAYMVLTRQVRRRICKRNWSFSRHTKDRGYEYDPDSRTQAIYCGTR
jgi:ABC-type transport system involved in cytochrome bd biosynthesis fused ATPase/permease subunit